MRRGLVVTMCVLLAVLVVGLAVLVPRVVSGSRTVAEAVWDGLGIGEPHHRQFQRDAAAVMRRVEPFPEGLVVVDRWEDCGQGADPQCSSIGLLVDDRRGDDAPVEALGALLVSRGWVAADDGSHLEARYVHEDGGTALVEDLSSRAARHGTHLFEDAYIDEHGAPGIAYLELIPG